MDGSPDQNTHSSTYIHTAVLPLYKVKENPFSDLPDSDGLDERPSIKLTQET